MSYTYETILSKAKKCRNKVKTEYRAGVHWWWSYYMAKAIGPPHMNIKKIKINDAPNPMGKKISRQVSKKSYSKSINNFVAFVEKNHTMPNYITVDGIQVRPNVWVKFLSDILVYYDKHGKLPAEMDINSKEFKKPTETASTVYDYFVQKTGKKPKTLDDVRNYMQYEGYSDDKYSNKQVMDKKRGNCVDLLQWLMNMTDKLGYESKCIHVQCRVSGTGHVFGKFKHKTNTGNKWITRDPAAVAGGNDIHKVWCEDGYLLAENPSWYNANRNR